MAASVRGLVVSGWEADGRPPWDVSRTIDEVARADAELANQHLNPAPALRARRLAGDTAAVETWTRGCRFPWLSDEPRGSVGSLRGLVVSTWEANGREEWDLMRTVEVVEGADEALTSQGLNPAPALRARRLAADGAAVEAWTRGCRFPWLGPPSGEASLPRPKKFLGPKVPGRMTPSFAFGYLERAILEGLGRREFRIPEVVQAIAFFGEPLMCVFCGSEKVTLWEHLVPVARGGETVLGNMVPSCQPCNDSKHHRPFDEWLTARAAKDPTAPGAQDVADRIARLRQYAEQFGYVITTPESRLEAERLLQVEELRRRARELRADVEAFLRNEG